ncbi:glycosyltransferase family 4 protein [Halomonas organivorans]
MTDVLNVVLNSFKHDSRVLKSSHALQSYGFGLLVVALHEDGLLEDDTVRGIKVDRVKLVSRPWPKAKVIQAIKYLEFLVRAVARYRRYKIVHCNDLNALPVGVLIKLFGSQVKVVYDCHEYETEINGLSRLEKQGRRLLERILLRFVDGVITVSDSIAEEYVRLYGISKPNLVLNCPPRYEPPRQDLFRESLGIRDDQRIFLYQGGLSRGRGIELLLEAFEGLVTNTHVLVCMGYGPLEPMVRKKASQSPNVFFHEAVSPDVLLNYTSSADYGVAFIEDSCLNYRYCLPNKLFEYLMAGIPVMTSNLVEMKRLVEREGVGIVAKDNTVDGFRHAIAASIEQDYDAVLGNVHRAREKYCWENQVKVLKEVYDAV